MVELLNALTSSLNAKRGMIEGLNTLLRWLLGLLIAQILSLRPSECEKEKIECIFNAFLFLFLISLTFLEIN